MKFCEFDEFYNKVISVYIEELLKKSKDFGGSLKVVDTFFKKNKVYKCYQNKKNKIKSYYMEKNVDALDGHKVASCFIYALLKNKLLKVNRFIPHLPNEILMANEYLAVYTAINIVDIYRRKTSNTNDYKILIPDTYHDKATQSEFINNFCKGLYYIKNMNHFDIFAYSTILFQLEKYTDVVNMFNDKNPS